MNSATAEGVAMAADPALAAMGDTSGLSPMESAVQRLTTSRLQLRGALIPAVAQAPGQGTASDGPITRKVRALWHGWRQRWRESPAVDLVFEAVHGWWISNPWRELAHTVADEVSLAVAPLVRKRPWTAVLAAASAGLLIANVRPWRWPMVAEQLVPLRRRAVNWIVGQALTAPIHTMLASLMAVVSLNRGTEGAATAPSTPASRDPVVPDIP